MQQATGAYELSFDNDFQSTESNKSWTTNEKYKSFSIQTFTFKENINFYSEEYGTIHKSGYRPVDSSDYVLLLP